MNRHLIALTLFMICYCKIYADQIIRRDPFLPTIELNCQEQTDLLTKQIQVWQFKGTIQGVNSGYQQIWLSTDRDWLAITDNNLPHILFPWTIQAVFSDKILWQANLPEYCNHKVLWTMPLTK